MPGGSAAPSELLAAFVVWGALGQLLLVALATMCSPGPATLSLAAAGSTYGFRRSLGYMSGVIVGTTLVLLAVATGVTATLLAVPALRVVFTALVVTYILRLAYRIATTPPATDDVEAREAPSFVGAVLFAVANPKAWVAIAATFASAKLADGAAADALAKIVILSGVIAVSQIAWLGVGSSFTRALRDARRARVVNGGLAIALVGATAVAVLH